MIQLWRHGHLRRTQFGNLYVNTWGEPSWLCCVQMSEDHILVVLYVDVWYAHPSCCAEMSNVCVVRRCLIFVASSVKMYDKAWVSKYSDALFGLFLLKKNIILSIKTEIEGFKCMTQIPHISFSSVAKLCLEDLTSKQ